MARLTHYRLCPFSRSVRLLLGELEIEVALAEERPWEWRRAFLALNPAGNLPVLELDDGLVLCGAYPISEYLGETVKAHPRDGLGVPTFPGNPCERAEVRRLVDWFHRKLDEEATTHLLREKVYKRFQGGGAPDAAVMRAVARNLDYSLGLIDHLMAERRWLAGEELSFADLAAAGHISCADYLREIDWQRHPRAKLWYARMKSRPAMRAILKERVPGAAPPPEHYADPDF